MPDEASLQEMREIVAAVKDEGSWSGRVRRRRLSDGEILVLDKIVGKVEKAMRMLSETQVPVLAKPSGIAEIVGIVEQIGASARRPSRR